MYKSMDRGLPSSMPFVTMIVSEVKSSNCNFVLLLVSNSLTNVMIVVGIFLFLRL